MTYTENWVSSRFSGRSIVAMTFAVVAFVTVLWAGLLIWLGAWVLSLI